jgi:chromosome segregation ATPase
MEHNLSLESNEEKIAFINYKISNLLSRKSAIEQDIQMVLDNPTMDRITITKIQAEIDDINAKILALEGVIEDLAKS